MTDNNDIKIAITKLEQGMFQNMCNKILFMEGYENINQLGSQTVSDRTTPGTPDTFIVNEGEYIFVEYTVQKRGLYNKILEDIEKCLKEITKCKIKNSKILYFHTSSDIKLAQYKSLVDTCEKENVELKIYNIDIIANLLKEKYPLIAKEFLKIEVDTLQILTPESFLEEYNSAISSVKINKGLLFRDDDKLKIIETINNKEITLVSGKSGVGKTHIILDLLINCKKDLKKYKIFCIKNRNQQLFYDLKKYLREKKEYLIFIDDINNINALDQILYFLDPINKLNLKIIATVRDYAKNKVIDKINKIEEETKKYFDIGYIKIEPLNDEQLIEIIKTQTEIKNEMNIRNILSVAQNNTRLMMMACNVLLKDNKRKKYKIEEIYQMYFKEMIYCISKESPDIMKSLAVVSILNAIDINDGDHKKIIDLFKINVPDFKKDLLMLHNNEIVDMIDENIAKVSEQCLSNYSVFLSVVINKDISLSDLIILMFQKNASRLIETINMINNVFYNEDTFKMTEESVKLVWKEVDKYSINKLEFLKCFGQILELETFDYCIESIKGLNINKIDIDYFDIIATRNKEYPKNELLNLLSLFKYSKNLNTVFDIIKEYLKKDNSIIPDLYKLFSCAWGFDDGIYYNDFHIQESIIDFLYNFAKPFKKDIYYLLLHIIKEYLKLSGDYSKSLKKRTITIVQYTFNENSELRSFRNKMFDILNELCMNSETKMYVQIILKDLYSYGYGEERKLKVVIEKDKEKVYELFEQFNPVDFKMAIVIDNITEKYRKLNINYKEIIIKNKTFKFYKLLVNAIDKNFREEKTKLNIKRIVDSLNTIDIKSCLKEIAIIESEEFLEKDFDVNNAISTFILELFNRPDVNIIEILKYLLKNNITKNISIDPVLKLCIESTSYTEVKEILKENDFSNKFYFMITCYSLVPEDETNEYELEELVSFLSKKVEITKGYSLHLNFLDKYMTIDKNIYPKILRIIYNTYKEDLFVLSLYTSLLFNKYSENSPEKLKKVFSDDYEILISVYLALKKYKDNSDFDGTYFKMFLDINSKDFINQYLSFLIINKSSIYHEDNELKYILDVSDEIIEFVISKIIEIKERYIRVNLLKKLFCKDEKISYKEETYLKKLINEFKNEEEILEDLFLVISDHSNSFKINCICEFLKICNDFEVFKKLRLESYSWSWSGSEVPLLDKRINYFVELNEKIKGLGINYIKHTLYINEIIDGIEERKKCVIKKEFLDDWL